MRVSMLRHAAVFATVFLFVLIFSACIGSHLAFADSGTPPIPTQSGVDSQAVVGIKVAPSFANEMYYGDKFTWNSVSANNDGRIYGNVVGATFTPSQSGAYYILVREIYVTTTKSGTDFQTLCADNGQILLLPNRGGSMYYVRIDVSHPLSVYDSTDTEAYLISSWSTNDPSNFLTVLPRPIVVSLSTADSSTHGGLPIDVVREGSTDYLLHTYGDEAYSFSFRASSGNAVFGDELKLDSTALLTGNGKNADWHVGDYPIALTHTQGEAGLYYTVTNSLGEDVTAHYSLVLDRPYSVRVTPCPLTLPERAPFQSSYSSQTNYTPEEGELESLQQASPHLQALELSGPFGALIAYFDVDPDLPAYGQEGSPFETEGVYAINESDGWRLTLFDPYPDSAASLVGADPLHADYTLVYETGDAYAVRIMRRPITIYFADSYLDNPPAGYDPEGWIAVEPQGMTAVYGRAYTAEGISEHQLTIADSVATLSFTLEGLETLAPGEQKVLDVGSYSIVDPTVDNAHYVVHVDSSVRWTVTPKPLEYATVRDWLGWDSLAEADEAHPYYALYQATTSSRFALALTGSQTGTPQAFCLAEYGYDNSVYSRSQLLTLTDPEVGEVVLYLTAEAHYPGYHALSLSASNYSLPEGGLFYVRVQPITVGLVVPEGAVYNGERYYAQLTYNGVSFNELFGEDAVLTEIEDALGSAATLSYKDKSNGKTVTAPQDAGTYTVTLSLKHSLATSPAYSNGGTSTAELKIAKAEVVITVTPKVTQKEFGKDLTLSKACSYTVSGVVGADKVAPTNEGLEEEAAVGTYPYGYEWSRGNANNYTVRVVDTSGNPISLQVKKGDAGDITIRLRVDSISGDGFTLVQPQVAGQTLEGLYLEYRLASDEEGEWIPLESTTVSGLKEGTTYLVRAVLPKNNPYFQLSTDYRSNPIEITTTLATPVFTQDELLTTPTDIVLSVELYGEGISYELALVAEQDYIDDDTLLESAVAVSLDHNGYLSVAAYYPLSPNTLYYLALVRVTNSTTKPSEVTVAYTRPQPPEIAPDQLVITHNSLVLPEGGNYQYYLVEVTSSSSFEDVTAGMGSIISAEEAGITRQDILDYLAALEAGEEVLRADSLSPTTNYVLAVWVEGDEFNPLSSELRCIRFRTTIDPANIHQYEGFGLFISQYLLIILTALMALLIIICSIVFAYKKKRLKGGSF